MRARAAGGSRIPEGVRRGRPISGEFSGWSGVVYAIGVRLPEHPAETLPTEKRRAVNALNDIGSTLQD